MGDRAVKWRCVVAVNYSWTSPWAHQISRETKNLHGLAGLSRDIPRDYKVTGNLKEFREITNLHEILYHEMGMEM